MDQSLPRRIGVGIKPCFTAFFRVCSALFQAMERARQRRALAMLSDALLRDIGLSRREAVQESTKPFWRE